LAELDLFISNWFHANTHPVATQLMLAVSLLHGPAGVLLASMVLGIALRQRRWWLLALLLSVPGGMLANVAAKHIVQRERPQFDDPILTLTTYSFPSGHTAGAALFYGFLVALVYAHPAARRWRGAVVGLGAVMVLLVAVSRVYLGVHYVTDVAGAITLAALWLGLCLSGVRALQRRRGGEAVHG
jgi:membrane-associated phospholipid phosphatase